ncbi:MAG: ZIP family metal transporter [Candidatus Gracilibacteria bacterium]
MDGLILGASYMVSLPVGIATTVAIILHEIPQEIGDFGVLLYSGFSKKKALFLNFMVALTSVLGVLVALLASSRVAGLNNFLIPFAAGGFIYIAGSDLIPELHKEVRVSRSLIQLGMFGVGVMIMLSLTLVEV